MDSLEYYSYMLYLRIEAGDLSPRQTLRFIEPIVEYGQRLAHFPRHAVDIWLNDTEQCQELRRWEDCHCMQEIGVMRPREAS